MSTSLSKGEGRHTHTRLLSAVNTTLISAELMKKCTKAQQLMNTGVISHHFHTTHTHTLLSSTSPLSLSLTHTQYIYTPSRRRNIPNETLRSGESDQQTVAVNQIFKFAFNKGNTAAVRS